MPEGLLRPGEVPGFLNVSRATFYRLRRRVPKVRIPVEHPDGRTTYLTRYDPERLRAWWGQYDTARMLDESRQHRRTA